MPSTYTSRLRLNAQAPGDNLNAWGVVLNTGVHQLIEDAVARRVAFSLSGPRTLATANGADDEARCAFVDVTGGSGGVVTIPAAEKLYVMRNGASGDVTMTTGGGAVATLKVGEVGWVACDGANVRRVQWTDMGGARLTGLGAPVGGADAATKAYVDAQAFGGVDLPGQGVGTAGQYIRSDGENANWTTINVAEVVGAAPLSGPNFVGGIGLAGGARLIPVTVSGLEFDWSQGEMQTKDAATSGQVTFSGVPAGMGAVLVLRLKISGGAILTWPEIVEWDNGVAPVLPNGINVVGFTTFDGGISIQGYSLGEAFA